MKKETKLYGTTATYLQEMNLNEETKIISETYEVDTDELAETYSKFDQIPIHLNKDKRREIVALAKTYLQLRKENS
jgi:hypothetical protein